jgi:large subunit ribosomal protein L10
LTTQKREENHVKRSEKAILIDKIKAQAALASIAVVTDFKGMSVEELTRLRVKLREVGGGYMVVKNTLARIAFTDGAHDSIKDKFKENCAVALGYDDPVPVAKALSEFARTSKIFAIRHGSLHGKVLSAAQVEDLARLPSREVLLAGLLGTMNAVPAGFVSLLANVPRGLLNVLKALEEKKAAA